MISSFPIGNKSLYMHVCEDQNDVLYESIACKNVYDSYDYDIKFWLNLTNGLEIAELFNANSIQYNLCRFRSTAFEQSMWSQAIDSMPDEMLMGLALGKPQFIIDFGARKPCSRALYQGIPIAARIISAAWGFDAGNRMKMFNRYGKVILTDRDFAKKVMKISKRQFHRLEYYKKFLSDNVDGIEIHLFCAKTDTDGYYDMHVKQAQLYV